MNLPEVEDKPVVVPSKEELRRFFATTPAVFLSRSVGIEDAHFPSTYSSTLSPFTISMLTLSYRVSSATPKTSNPAPKLAEVAGAKAST